VRSATHKLILNLQHEQLFTNACVKSPEFVSLVEAAIDGNQDAAKAVNRYQNRPAVELYDVINDPLEMKNIAGDPNNEQVITALRAELNAWMKSQGDLGVETEMKANDHKTKARRPAGRKKTNSANSADA